MKLIDTHAHLFLEEFSADLPEVIARAKASGVDRILMPNIDSTTVDALNAACDEYRGYLYPMMGLHPTSVNADYQRELAVIKQALDAPVQPYVAIGEIGMDLYWDKTFLREQQHALDIQIGWALERQLPVVLHSREAFTYIYEVLRPYKETSLTGVFHSFTGTADEARQMMELSNFYIGVNGVLTFKKSTLSAVLSEVVPLERLLLETDAPYLTPVPHRGKRNESAYLIYTLEKLAEVYHLSSEEVAKVTTNNAQRLFESRFRF
jgi:TatD DNase family protein